MPGFVHHTLFVALGKRQNEVVTSGVVLQPAKGGGVLKALGEVGFRSATIAEIHGIASAVLGVARWRRHLGTFFGGLIPFGGHVEENGLLQVQRAESTKQPQIDPVSGGRAHHRVEGLSSLQIQLNPRLKHNQLIGFSFSVGEVTQEAAIGIGTLTKACDLQTLCRLAPGQQGWSHHQHRKASRTDKNEPEQQAESAVSLALTGRSRPTGDRNVLPLGASRRGGPNQGADACCFDRKGSCQVNPQWLW